MGGTMAAVLRIRHKRVGLELPVDVTGRDAAGSRFVEGTRTVNVSAGGLCFESRRNLAIGAQLDLTIPLPPGLRERFGGREIYRVRALVCRVERQPGHKVAKVGVRFLSEIER
jgi:hypothetical protein